MESYKTEMEKEMEKRKEMENGKLLNSSSSTKLI
jgi:hypothetical protein